MSNKPIGWPTHGNAVNSRNDVADDMLAIIRELNHLRSLVRKGEATRIDIMISVDFIRERAGNSLVEMIKQGAPVELPR